jgi:hypothetical protein
MWITKFVVCSIIFGGCSEAALKDKKIFTDKDKCEEYAEVMSDVLIQQMEQQNIYGEVHYGCVKYEDKKKII